MQLGPSTVSWLCLVTIVCLVGGLFYNLRSGHVSVGVFTYRRGDRPGPFYATILGAFGVGLAAVIYIWLSYG